MRIARRRRPRVPTWAVVVGLLTGLLVVAGCWQAADQMRSAGGGARGGSGDVSTESPVVRVRVVAGEKSVQIDTGRGPTQLSATSGNLDRRWVSSRADGVVLVNGRPYRGSLRVLAQGNGTVDVINDVSIDDYLRGVVPSEVFASWPDATLRAQAIVARTFALYEFRSRGGRREFDLHADVRSQVYKGVEAERASTNRAVESTRGMVLAFGARGKERIFPAYFSSTCGGITQHGSDAFGLENPVNGIAPLRARDAEQGCRESPRYNWPEFSVRKDELSRRFRAWGQREKHAIGGLGAVRTVVLTERNELGRPRVFVVTDSSGRRYQLSAEQMRNATNASRGEGQILYSSFFVPVDAGDSIRFTEGRGWGHGVGMCQYCAAAWGKRGDSEREIVLRSYPGAVLVRAYP